MCFTAEQKRIIKKVKAGKLVLRIIEEEKTDCVICGEYFAESTMTEIKGDETFCCDGCYKEHGTECWKCDEKIIPDIEEEEVDCYIHTYYLDNCDDGDCCATCMAEIVEEHKEEQEENEKFKVEEDEDEEVRTIYVTRPLDGCVYYLYLCDECDFMTRNDDPDCSNCGAKRCMMAKCIE